MSENFLSFETTPKAQLGQTDFFPTLTYKTTTLSAFSTVFDYLEKNYGYVTF